MSMMDMAASDYGYTHPFPPYSFTNSVMTPEQASHHMALFNYHQHGGVDGMQTVSSASTVAAAGMTMDAPLPVVSVSESGGDSEDFSPDSPALGGVDHSLMDAAIMRDLAVDASAVAAAATDLTQGDLLQVAPTESSLDNLDADGEDQLDYQDGANGGTGGGSVGNGGAAPSVKKKRRGRVRFTDRQIESLEQRFMQDQYLPAMERTHIANGVGLNESQVKTWFQNRRAKSKRAAKRKARTNAAHLQAAQQQQQQQQQQGTALQMASRNTASAAAVAAAATATYSAAAGNGYGPTAFTANAAMQYQATQQAAAAAALYASHQPYATTAMLNGVATVQGGAGAAPTASAYAAQPYATAAAGAAAINMGGSPTYQTGFGAGAAIPFDGSAAAVAASQAGAYSLFGTDTHTPSQVADYYRLLGASSVPTMM